MKVFVTGITGFVGAYLGDYLLEQGDEVLGASLEQDWPAGAADSPVAGCDVLPWDITVDAPPEIAERVARFAPDAIVHLAALSVPGDCAAACCCGDSEQPTSRAIAVNVTGSRNVMRLAASLPAPVRVLMVSSSHVYAPASRLSPVVNEESPVAPTSAYGKTKLAAEEVVRLMAGETGVEAIIARAFQHTGPGQSSRMMVSDWVRQIVHSHAKMLKVRCREIRRDISDVRDVVRAYRLLLERGHSGQTYNVGSGVVHRGEEILDLLFTLHGPRRPVEELTSGEQWRPTADITRIMRDTGWSPTIPLRQTLADMIEWEERRQGGE